MSIDIECKDCGCEMEDVDWSKEGILLICPECNMELVLIFNWS